MKLSVVEQPPTDRPSSSLAEIALLFLKLGSIAFGGPAAHIAMIEEEVVRRRKWLKREEFLDLLGATNLIPGPNSTELAIHIGHRQAGWPGLVVAGACFILPATLIVTGFAWIYVRFGRLPETGALLYGVKPVIIAIVLQALWALGRAAIKSKLLGAIGLVVFVLSVMRMNELALLAVAGLVAILLTRSLASARKQLQIALAQPAVVGFALSTAQVAAFGLWPLFLFFIKVGSILFGSGYVLLAFLRRDLVERWGWLTDAQLLDAVAVGQFTPGPVFTTATFIGYLLAGTKGALIATVGIFLPAFIFVALSGPIVPRLRRSKVAGAFLDGVNVASLALMAQVTFVLGRSALVDPFTVAIAMISAFLLLRYRLNAAWLVAGGALIGLLSLI
ncbi:MAG TPA: chromate efflux transporter [Pyrinomonadaceae bacterium]|nr:chromate efflux transporter [Pyrinomonadaceae bacterium]